MYVYFTIYTLKNTFKIMHLLLPFQLMTLVVKVLNGALLLLHFFVVVVVAVAVADHQIFRFL